MEKHGAGVEEACAMVDTFASLGVVGFDVTQTDVDGQRRSFRRNQSGRRLRCWMGVLLGSAIARQQNVIVRPRGALVPLIQLDDLSGMMVERLRRAAFLILATSPDNHQVWVAIRSCCVDFARRLRDGSAADRSASGAARLAGSVNFKRKYAPHYPMVRLLTAQPDHVVERAELEGLGVVAAPAVPRRLPSCIRVSVKRWPSYECCLKNAPLAHNSERPDVSRADFTFCMIAIDWGWSVADTCQRLLEISSKARVAGEAYAQLTVQRAAAVIRRRDPRAHFGTLTPSAGNVTGPAA